MERQLLCRVPPYVGYYDLLQENEKEMVERVGTYDSYGRRRFVRSTYLGGKNDEKLL